MSETPEMTEEGRLADEEYQKLLAKSQRIEMPPPPEPPEAPA